MDAHEIESLLNQNGVASEQTTTTHQSDQDTIFLTAEQLAESGIDLNNMSNADVEALLGLVNSNNAVSHSDNQSTTSQPALKRPGSTHLSPPDSKRIALDNSTSLQTPVAQNSTRQLSNAENEQITEITELDHDMLTSLFNDGMVKFFDEQGNEISASIVLDDTPTENATPTSTHHSYNDIHRRLPRTTLSNGTRPVTSTNASCSKGEPQFSEKSAGGQSKPDSLLGLRVMIRRLDGVNIGTAVVRYVRPGVGYKVQFDGDNRFEWVTERQILPLFDQRSSPDYCAPLNQASKTSSSSHIIPGQQSSTTSSIVSSPLLNPTTTYAGRRVTSARHAHHQQQNGSASCARNSFTCPICERKIHDEEPSYIVIRLPACGGCASSKILVLDEQIKRTNVGM